MSVEWLLFIGYCILCVLYLHLVLSKPKISRKYIIKSNIQAQTDAIKLYNDSDKLALIIKQLETVDFNNVIASQKEDFKNKILNSIK